MIMPPSWKAEIDKTVNEITAGFADAQESAGKQGQKIATRIEALTDELRHRNAKQEADEPQKRTRENRTIAGLFATAIFTCALAGFSAWQVYETRRAYDPIKQSADAAKTAGDDAAQQVTILKKQSDVMRGQLEEMVLDQRPWIHFEGLPQIASPLELSSPRVASMKVTYTVKNSGKNPARRVRIVDDLFPLVSPDQFLVSQAAVCARALVPNAFVPNQVWPFDSEYVLFPGQQVVETKTIVMVGLGEVREWNNPKRAVVHPLLIGCIDYQFLSSDAHHQTGFIFQIRPKVQHPNLTWGIDLDEGAAQPADLDLRVSMAGTGPAN
jgi:hypothetical protein